VSGLNQYLRASSIFAAVLLTLAGGSGCSRHPTERASGDARLLDTGSFSISPRYVITLPAIEIGPGEAKTFVLDQVPKADYQVRFALRSSSDEAIPREDVRGLLEKLGQQSVRVEIELANGTSGSSGAMTGGSVAVAWKEKRDWGNDRLMAPVDDPTHSISGKVAVRVGIEIEGVVDPGLSLRVMLLGGGLGEK
jgi:hypothetical protein